MKRDEKKLYIVGMYNKEFVQRENGAWQEYLLIYALNKKEAIYKYCKIENIDNFIGNKYKFGFDGGWTVLNKINYLFSCFRYITGFNGRHTKKIKKEIRSCDIQWNEIFVLEVKQEPKLKNIMNRLQLEFLNGIKKIKEDNKDLIEKESRPSIEEFEKAKFLYLKNKEFFK